MRTATVISLSLSLALASVTLAQDRVAQLNKVEGKVTVTRAASGKVDQARQLGPRVRNGSVFAKDVVATSASAQASMVFSDGSLLELAANTSLAVEGEDLSKLARTEKPEGRNIKVLAGDLLANVVPNPRVATRFETPSGVAAVKGTTLTIRSVRTTLDGGDAGVGITEGDVEFIFENGGTTALSSGTEIFAAWSSERGLRVRVLFSPEPLDIRLGGYTLRLPRAAKSDELVEVVVKIDEEAGGLEVENTSTGDNNLLTLTDPAGQTSDVPPGGSSGLLQDASLQNLSRRSTRAATTDEKEEEKSGEGEPGDQEEEKKEATQRENRFEDFQDADLCAAVVCECGACSGGVCLGTAGCETGFFCENGKCVSSCDGVVCECGRCEDGVCVGIQPGCPVGSRCESGVCVPLRSPDGGG